MRLFLLADWPGLAPDQARVRISDSDGHSSSDENGERRTPPNAHGGRLFIFSNKRRKWVQNGVFLCVL